jgi:hypothetical protein
MYIIGHECPPNVPLRRLVELFTISQGTVGTAQAEDGPLPVIASAEEPKRHKVRCFEGEAICVPLVSATGHGHAAIEQAHYVVGKFATATIAAVMLKRTNVNFYVTYFY